MYMSKRGQHEYSIYMRVITSLHVGTFRFPRQVPHQSCTLYWYSNITQYHAGGGCPIGTHSRVALPSVGMRGCPPSLWPNEREVNLTIKEWFFFGLCYTVEVHIYHASNGGVHIAHTTRHEPRALCGDFLVSYIRGATSKLCIVYSNITQIALWATCMQTVVRSPI